MSSFDLFRSKMKREADCRKKFETRFITEGASPIIIHILRLDKDRDATMVFTDVEGPDSAIVFTPMQDSIEENLQQTDYYTWDNKMFFVYENVIVPREVSYIKQKAYHCNAKVYFLDSDAPEDDFGGYFVSSLRSYVGTELQQKINISDKERPILIMPKRNDIAVGNRVQVGDKPWKIIDFDAITNPGIAYISLERDFFLKDFSSSVVQPEEEVLHAGIEYTFETQDGYFNSSSPLNVKSRTATQIVFDIPYGVDTVSFAVKDAEGNAKEYNYKVVI